MTFQDIRLFKFTASLAILFISLASSQPAREVGRVIVDGVEKPVFYEDKGGPPQKYFLGESGNRVDLAGHQRRKAQEKKEKFGVFGKKLYDTLSTMKAEEEVDVHITFALRALPGQLRNKKLSKEDADAQLQASFRDGVETLGRRFGRLPSEVVDFKGKNSLRLRLRKSELLEFKTNSRIQSIELPVNPSHEKVLRQAPLEESFMGSGWSSGGLHFSGDCGGGYGCGSGTYVGVLERNPIWNSDSADHLNGSWFEKRPGTPIAPRHPHGLWTSSIIRNSGPGLGGSAFNGGGAYNANLSLSYPVAPESTMQDAYDWLLSRYNKIISHSWRFPRYLGGTHEAEANEFERQMDMASAGYPYVLNVLAAGNSGDTADGGENDDCVDSSAVYNAPGWTAEQCQTVAWWNHNGLIVGAVDDDSTRSPFSAFRNGPEDNESPHVMVRGSGIQLPWMAPLDSSTTCPTDTAVANASGPLCGTSMAAPTVAALGAHIAGIGGLSSYPEVVKGIIIASATSRPIRRSAWKRYAYDFYPFLDREIGAGIPHQPTADSIVKNEKYVSNFSSGAYGFKKFFVPSYQSSYEDVDTITITHPQGGRIHFYMTWVGNPSNVTPGTRYAPDDMDLHVETENTWDYYSNSYQNTTEEVVHPILPDSATTFYVKKRLYYRSLDENTPIWGSLVWTYAPPPVVEIHSPLDSSYINQNEVPVDWSIDGKPDSSESVDYLVSEGPHLIKRCYDVYYFCDLVTVFLDKTAPVVEIISPVTGTITGDATVLVKWTKDAVADSQVYNLVQGTQQIILNLTDAAGNVGADTISITRGTYTAGYPIFPTGATLNASDVRSSSMTLTWTAATADFGIKSYNVYGNKKLLSRVSGNQLTCNVVGLFINTNYEFRVEAMDSLGQYSINGPIRSFRTSNDLPPDPSTVASPIPQSQPTSLASSVAFLYQGPDPVQTGVIDSLMDPVRTVVLRGVVRDRSGSVLSGVTVSILDHSELGSTLTRTNGEFDIVINGGGPTVVVYKASGYLEAQRILHSRWQEYHILDTVTMVPLDTMVTMVDLSPDQPMQAVRASVVSDNDGTRQATLLLPTNTVATLVFPDGTTKVLDTIRMRATEYTVGESGPSAMPGTLPGTSGYTYAVEYSLDEAIESGAEDVQFTDPIYGYVENFVGIPVGIPVPSAYYDKKKGLWIPSEDGLVIKITAINDGKADLIIDTSGIPATDAILDSLGISAAERTKLANLYSVDQTLWRVPIRHFTPYDFNFPLKFPDSTKPPTARKGKKDEDQSKCDEEVGSIIDCHRQSLGETVEFPGMPSINYRSNRAPSSRWNRLEIALTGGSVPFSINHIGLEVTIAGRIFRYSYPRTTNLTQVVEWDGLDVYNRPLRGKQVYSYKITYGYEVFYAPPPSLPRVQSTGNLDFGPRTFGTSGGVSFKGLIQARTLYYSSDTYSGYFGSANIDGIAPGWTLENHHVYDPIGGVLHLGNGRDVSAQTKIGAMYAVAGGGMGWNPAGLPAKETQLGLIQDIDVASDGTVYMIDEGYYGFWTMNPQGFIRFTNLQKYIKDVEVAPDGTLFFSEKFSHRIWKMTPDSVLSVIVGSGLSGFQGDGGDATDAKISSPNNTILGLDGSLYIADGGNRRVRKVTPDGFIQTVVGTGLSSYNGEEIPALQANINVDYIAVSADGSIYIADKLNCRIRKVDPSGIITTVAGNGTSGTSGDGGLARDAQIVANRIEVVNTKSGGTLIYISDFLSHTIRVIDEDGIINRIAGGGLLEVKDGTLATYANLLSPPGLAVAPNGNIYITKTPYNFYSVVYKVLSKFPDYSSRDIHIPSPDGKEVYRFSPEGRHLKTFNAFTGSKLLEFTYNTKGGLTQITDAYGNVTEIERDYNGYATNLINPYNQILAIGIGNNGQLNDVSLPTNETHSFSYNSVGLLAAYMTPRNNEYIFTYDSLGRLVRDDDPIGGFKALSREDTAFGVKTTVTTAMNRNRIYRLLNLPNLSEEKILIDPAGYLTRTLTSADGKVTSFQPDSTQTIVELGPEPQFSLQSMVASKTIVNLPSSLSSTTTASRHVVLADSLDPLTLVSYTDTIEINNRKYFTWYVDSTRTWIRKTPEGRMDTTRIDSLGRVVESIIPGYEKTMLAYDNRGRLEYLTRGFGGDSRITSFTYNAAGYLSEIEDPEGRTSVFEYDLAGRMKKETLPDGREVDYTYDAEGNMASITPPGRPTHFFDFNPVGLDTLYDPPVLGGGNWNTAYSYNLERQLLAVNRPDGLEIGYLYDNGGRLDSILSPVGAHSFYYHLVTGRLDSIASPYGINLSFGHDGPLTKSVTWSGGISGSISMEYDANYFIISQTINGSDTILTNYDNDGLIQSIGSLEYSFDALNERLLGSTLDTITDHFGYNGYGEVDEYRALMGADTLFRCLYTRDKIGRITQKTETVEGVTKNFEYTYDLAGRIAEVELNNIVISSFDYDSNSNRLTRSYPGGIDSGLYDNQDRLLQYNGAEYVYNSHGDLKIKVDNGDTTKYNYDVFGNLLEVIMPNGTKVEYLIDGQNRRVGKKVNGAFKQGLLYQGPLEPVAEIDSLGNMLMRFVYGSKANVPDYLVKGDTTFRIISDHLGSVRLVVNSKTGVIVQRMDYDQFGKVILDDNPGFQPFGFAGGLYDLNTVLVRFGARDYDPEIGRWTSKDPLRFKNKELNFYAYVENDPVNYLDMTGKSKGGKQNIDTEGFNKKSNPADVEKALQEAIKNKQAKRILKLKGLLKVIKRGGAYLMACGVFLELILDSIGEENSDFESEEDLGDFPEGDFDLAMDGMD